MRAMVLAICMVATAAHADLYKLEVTRVGENLYKVVGSNGFNSIIQTRYCYEYAYSEDVVLDWDGYSGTLTFISDRTSCDVKAIVR